MLLQGLWRSLNKGEWIQTEQVELGYWEGILPWEGAEMESQEKLGLLHPCECPRSGWTGLEQP